MSPAPCVVAFCTNKGTLTFPKDESRRAEWIQAIEHVKPGLTIRKHSRICSDHFRASDLSKTVLTLLQPDIARKCLKKTAVPSVFSWKTDLHRSPSCSQDLNLFTHTNVINTYERARVRPITFVEEQSHVDILKNDLEDPLKFSNESTKYFLKNETEDAEEHNNNDDHVEYERSYTRYNTNHFAFELDVAEELEIPAQEELVPEKLLDNNVEKLEKSVQTQDYNIGHGFSLRHYKDDDIAIYMFTGLENFDKLMLVFNTLGQSAHKLNYFYGLPPQNLDALEQFFLTLLILRRRESMEMIATMYRVTVKQIYNIFITWIRFMSLQWRNLDLWVPKESVKEHMPLDFYDKYPSTRVILDVTECPIKKPKSPLAQQATFSSHKNKNTIKFLVGVSPGGFISSVSPCYGGSATDRQLIERSPILTRFDKNDEIMVNEDKGLNIQDIFLPYGVKVNTQAFIKNGNGIAPKTLKAT